MRPAPAPDFLAGYPPTLVGQVRQSIADGRLGPALRQRYPQPHGIRSDRALWDYARGLKERHLRQSPPLDKVLYDGKLQALRRALGTHARIPRVHGGGVAVRREIRIAEVFRAMPEEFLRMIVVHELAHFREAEHDKAFYRLCLGMEPDYHQFEFDLRCYLTHLDAGGAALWSGDAPARASAAAGPC